MHDQQPSLQGVWCHAMPNQMMHQGYAAQFKEKKQLIAKPAHSPSLILVTLSGERFRLARVSRFINQWCNAGIWIHILICWHTCQTDIVIACQQC